MNVETICEEIKKLSPEEEARLLRSIGPELCQAAMQDRETMQQMMPHCMEMMQGAGCCGDRQGMMGQMMGKTRDRGK